ncbi:pilus assembly protein [Thermanaerothrix sp.]|jgi:Flp pilus assembly pilin Flp|uniref:Flp family type IVb pilin n=1 Tax=Thermanaerothrix sp. TaxID=2972675 RepID=UPI002ADE193C|nr:pilus assembly protein [Thermanaerothrix sp.]
MNFLNSEKAQGLAEYALILVFVALVVILVLSLFGTNLESLYNNAIGQIKAVIP